MDGVTLLHQACLHGHRKLVELLIEHKANINAITTTDWLTPLHYVCQYNHKDVRLSVCTCVYQLCLCVIWDLLRHTVLLWVQHCFWYLRLVVCFTFCYQKHTKRSCFKDRTIQDLVTSIIAYFGKSAITVRLIGYWQNFLSVHHCIASHDPIIYRLYYCYWRTMLSWTLKMSTSTLHYISVAIMATWSLPPYWWSWVKDGGGLEKVVNGQ